MKRRHVVDLSHELYVCEGFSGRPLVYAIDSKCISSLCGGVVFNSMIIFVMYAWFVHGHDMCSHTKRYDRVFRLSSSRCFAFLSELWVAMRLAITGS